MLHRIVEMASHSEPSDNVQRIKLSSVKTPIEFDPVNHGMASLVKRFWDGVKVSGRGECWEWQKSLSVHGGYGQLMLWDGWKRTLVKAHQLAYRIHKGDPPPGTMVCHKCNNPKCCNPEHLYAGTRKDNWRDAIQAGTASILPHHKGEDCLHSKLTEAQVKFIRDSKDKGVVLAKVFGVTKTSISHIRSGKTWKHL